MDLKSHVSHIQYSIFYGDLWVFKYWSAIYSNMKYNTDRFLYVSSMFRIKQCLTNNVAKVNIATHTQYWPKNSNRFVVNKDNVEQTMLQK